MRLFIHIGYPKSMSTSLQRGLFALHPQIYYLGIGIKSNTDYRTDELTRQLPNALLFANEFYFEKNLPTLRSLLAAEINRATIAGYETIGLSLENLSFCFSPGEIDPYRKLSRLSRLISEMGLKIKVIAIIREQTSLIQSLYGESVKAGLIKTFKEYISYLYDFRNISSLNYFLYNEFYNHLKRTFPDWDVHFLEYEKFMVEKKLQDLILINKLCSIIGVGSGGITNLPHFNNSLSKAELYNLYLVNKAHPFGVGKDQFCLPQMHKLAEFYQGEDVFVKDFYSDVKQKNENLKVAAKCEGTIPDDFFSHDFAQFYRMQELFRQNNIMLKAEHLPDLSPEYF